MTNFAFIEARDLNGIELDEKDVEVKIDEHAITLVNSGICTSVVIQSDEHGPMAVLTSKHSSILVHVLAANVAEVEQDATFAHCVFVVALQTMKCSDVDPGILRMIKLVAANCDVVRVLVERPNGLPTVLFRQGFKRVVGSCVSTDYMEYVMNVAHIGKHSVFRFQSLCS